ncbi:MAG: hypothetical protein JNL74_15105 [Fibrobacteres bacterium]|nr:hypothetical protein [Fibrobacterota bacterium]
MVARSVAFLFAVSLMSVGSLYAQQSTGGKSLVLETLTIEGKIKKPQVALISIEKRPVIKPMALASLESRRDIAKNVKGDVFEYRYYDKPFNVDAAQIE